MKVLDFLHPSAPRLRAWLDTGDSDDVGLHVESCAKCAERLEQLDADGAGGEPSPVADALAAMLAAPSDLGERVVRSVELRQRRDVEIALFAGLLSVGIDTARLMAAAPTDATVTHPNAAPPAPAEPEETE